MTLKPDDETLLSDRFPVLARIAAIADRWSGVRAPFTPRSRIALGLYWLVLLVLVYLFAGHSSKFVYVDF